MLSQVSKQLYKTAETVTYFVVGSLKTENQTDISLSMEMSRLTRDGTVEPVSRDQILRREREQGNIHFLCSADHVQD